MKRALPGKKSKKASPARKPAAARPKARAKSKLAKPAKPAASKSTPRRKSPAPAATKKKEAKPMAVSGPAVAATAAKRKRIPTAKRKFVRRVAVRKNEAAILAQPMTTAPAIAPPNPRMKPMVAEKLPGKVARPVASKPQFTVPAFLLEGDEPSHPLTSGPGEKFALGPTPPLDHFDEAKTALPDSYGTGRLFLTARDPHWLYAHWDFTMQEQFRYNARSVDRHMVLRLHAADKPGRHISEVHVHPESRHWFAHVDDAGKSYAAEIGYYQPGRKWQSLAVSEPQRTPPDNISADSTIEFATIPLELSFETMLTLLKEHADDDAGQNLPLARALENLRRVTRHKFPDAMYIAEWTPEQEQALADILTTDRTKVALPSSQDSAGIESGFNELSWFAEAPSSYTSSFFGGAEQKDFWLNVNAELIIFGATEPNATVTFAGKQIPLRPDGSFRFHFALPDGQYELPVTAVSADGTDGRAAELKFTRATEIRGAVAAAPQDPALRPPPAESV